ncbi:hypothetical protein BLA29_012745 [Euroglyphus maynei]|uniref:Uncharacterized protein n=1 Tax=Euroglyphus maynei TaxID=6958 RepID=A0A1Y3ANF9_EURMA|nr:hypothetical protein BLA29_012745 [Euroglyphus maynei]
MNDRNRYGNSLREMEWEYLDRRQSSTRRPSSSSTSTTTTTTTTRRSYHYHPTGEKTYRPIFTQPSRSPNEYPLRDCQQECVPRHYLQHYYDQNCRSIFSRDCNCAKRFNCPDDGIC